MADRKQQPGIIGLGSRLFVAKESTWGTAIVALASFEGYNLYPQPGGRPQKTTTPIEVTQLFPSAIRRKPLRGISSVEGSYTFALPKENNEIFWQMITGTAVGVGSYLLGYTPIDSGTGTARFTNSSAYTNVNAGVDQATIAGVTSSYPSTNTLIDSVDFVDAGTGGAEQCANGSATLLAGDVHLQIDLGTSISALGIDVGDTIDVTIEQDTGTAYGAMYTACTGGGMTVGGFLNNVLYFEVDLNGINGVTDATTLDPDDVFQSITQGDVEHGGADDAFVNTLNDSHTITASTANTIDIGTIDFTDITNAETLVWSGATVTTPGGKYGFAEEITDSYTFVNTIGTTRIAQYSGMTPSSMTLSVSPDATISTEVSFLGKEEVVKDVKTTSINSFFGESDSPFVLDASNRILRIDPTNEDNFDNFNDVYPSWNASLRIGRKQSGFISGTTHYQFWNPSADAWVTLNSADLRTAMSSDQAIVPFSDFTLTIENSIEFSNYVNGEQARTKPIQTSFREVTVGITIPYNKYTSPLIDSMFNHESFACELRIDDGAGKSVYFSIREMCITGDGGLGDIPEGEITTSLTFTAYAPHENIDEDDAFDPVGNYSPLEIEVNV